MQPSADPDEGIAFALWSDKPERMQNFYRYNAAAERAYYRALHERLRSASRLHSRRSQSGKWRNQS